MVEKCIFVEVKNDKDFLESHKKRFAKLVKEELDIDFIIFDLQVNIEEGIVYIEK